MCGAVSPACVPCASQVIYHYGDDRVTSSFRSYAKDGTEHVVVQVDPFSRPPSTAVQLEEFQQLQAAERDCLNEVRDAHRQAKHTYGDRLHHIR